jgi:uncharacterized metal-binding protein YceD (DUF177 family)
MSKADSYAPPPKIFSHLILVDEVPEQGLDVTLSADAPTRQALAKADGLVGLAMLDADFHVARQGLSSFNVTGTVRAKITQTCVLTLEPFDSDLAEEVDVDFVEASAAAQAATQADTLLGAQSVDRDPPDPIEDGAIDLGALAAEFLALGLDPYPHKPGAEFAPVTDPHDVTERPFDVLKKLTDQS